jgi:alkylated DNA repair dioxygenase AlkB
LVVDVPDHTLFPRFLPFDETRAAWGEIETTTPWREDTVTLFGRTHPVPRLTALYGDPGAHYSYSRLRLDPLPWTPLLTAWRDRVREASSASYNSVLLNFYRDGRDSNGWHADDEAELGPEPVIASLSLGVTRTMAFRRRDETTMRWKVDLADGDLLVMWGNSQRDWLHSVPKSTRVRGPRINLTFRWIDHSIAHQGRPRD